MSRLHLKSQAEVIKLGRVLDQPPGRLGYLGKLRPDDLRALREMATDAHYRSDSARFQRVAFASRLLPVTLTALIAQKAFGPLLCARIAGVLDTDHAIALADRMPADFLAELAIRLDPRRCSEIVAGMPAKQIAEVAEILATRDEHVAMGRRAHDRRRHRGVAGRDRRAVAPAHLLRPRGRRRAGARDRADVEGAPAQRDPRSHRARPVAGGSGSAGTGLPRPGPGRSETSRPRRTTGSSPGW